MSKPSQVEVAYAMLDEAGPAGVHSFTLRRAFIGNPSERMRDLEKLGHPITTSPRERLNGEAWGVRYFLTAKLDGGPAAGSGSSALNDHDPVPGSDPPGGAPQDLPLFELPPPAPRSALLEDEEAAA